MAKIDATRNYYADLSVSANASENDIRKAFRKLALECHPDRNPGREQEYVAKFQQIQAAHEVLSDPLQRAKYDQERKKYRNLHIPPYNPNTPRARPPPPPRNAYTSGPTGGQYYRAAPPKPPPPQPAPRFSPASPSPRPPPPPQQYSAYTSGADRFTSKNFRTAPTAQKAESARKDADARANVFTAWQKMKSARAEPRPQNPNNPNNPNGAPFGGSQRMRASSSSRRGFDPGMPGADEGQARSSYRSNYERPSPSPLGEDTGGDVPFAEANRVRTPYFSSKSGERTSMFGEGIGRSASVRNSPTHAHKPSMSTDAGFQSDSAHQTPQRNSYNGPPKNQPFPHMYVSSSEEEDEGVQKGKKYRSQAPSPRPKPAWGAGFFATPQSKVDQASPPTNPFKSKSEEGINMKFSPSDWHGKFEGKADYFAPNLQKTGSSKGRISPSRGRPNQRGTAGKTSAPGQSQPPPPVPPFTQPSLFDLPPQSPLNDGISGPHTAKFAPDAWAETFKEPSWAYPTKSKEISPRRGSTATKRVNTTRMPPVAPEGAPNSDGQPSERKAKYQAFAEDATLDADPMDVDSGTQSSENVTSNTSIPATSPAAKAKTTTAGTMPNGNVATSPSASAKSPAAGLNGLANLANVEPFMPTTNNGMGLGHLKDALPFKSQASGAHPTKLNTARKLKYPDVPIAPSVPARLDPLSTNEYFNHMESYVRKYRKWNDDMLKHFLARKEELNDLDDNFIHHRGETTKKFGFQSYLAKMKEDELVHVVWQLGREKHMEAMEKCEEVRNKTIKQYIAA